MENLIFGLPHSTFFVITGIPAFIIVFLVVWGFWYKSDDNVSGNNREGGVWDVYRNLINPKASDKSITLISKVVVFVLQ